MDHSYYAAHVEKLSVMHAMIADVRRSISKTRATIDDTREAILQLDW